MPRPSTGRLRGRPKGTVLVDDAHRKSAKLTIRITEDLYNRLDTYAAQHGFTRKNNPPLGVYVREALEEYLARRGQRYAETSQSPPQEIRSTTLKEPLPLAEPPRRELTFPRAGSRGIESMIDLLREHGPLTSAAIQQARDVDRQTVTNIMNQLRKSRRVQRDEKGRYSLTAVE